MPSTGASRVKWSQRAEGYVYAYTCRRVLTSLCQSKIYFHPSSLSCLVNVVRKKMLAEVAPPQRTVAVDAAARRTSAGLREGGYMHA